MGCDLFVSPTGLVSTKKVSIHAPTWGATKFPNSVAVSITAFQSTHPRGVRLPSSPRWDKMPGFQSTHPRGVRRSTGMTVGLYPAFQSTHPRGVRLPARCFQDGGATVSIHAPTWGATNLLTLKKTDIKFQSTHPRGVRPSGGRFRRGKGRFNPRTHVGCD